MGARSKAISALNYDEYMIIYDKFNSDELNLNDKVIFQKKRMSKSIISGHIFFFTLKKRVHICPC